MYLVTAKTKATAQDFPGSTVEWAVGQTREVHDSLIQEFKNNPAAWTVSGGATTSTVTATPSAQGGVTGKRGVVISSPGGLAISADVCVYGATPGGIMAAVAAARQGASVVLLEPSERIGGMTTGGLSRTDMPGSFSTATFRPITMEFYDALAAEYGLTRAAYYADTLTEGLGWTHEPHLGLAVFERLLAGASITPVMSTEVESVTKSGAKITQIRTTGGLVVMAHTYIDATYSLDLGAMAGVGYIVGREASVTYGESLAGVASISGSKFAGVDPYRTPGVSASGLLAGVSSTALATAGTADSKVMAYNYRLIMTTDASIGRAIPAPKNYVPSQYELLRRMMTAGKFTTLDEVIYPRPIRTKSGKSVFDVNNKGEISTNLVGGNWDYPNAKPAQKRQIALKVKEWILGLWYFLRTDPSVPSGIQAEAQQWMFVSGEFDDYEGFSPELYVREARRMVSDFVITQGTVQGTSDTTRTDGIALGYYQIDSHLVDRGLWGSGGTEIRAEGTLAGGALAATYKIPYAAIVPKASECTNLLVPVCLSASHVGMSSVRVEPTWMDVGASAGIAAALAAKYDVTVQNVPVDHVQFAQGLSISTHANSRPIAGDGIVLDTDFLTRNGSVTFTGSWTAGTSAVGFHGTGYHSDGNAGKGTKFCDFEPVLPGEGYYEVWAEWPRATTRSPAVPVQITSESGVVDVVWDQIGTNSTHGSVLLGTYWFKPAGGRVRIGTAGTDSFSVIADAIRFKPVF